MTAHASSPSDVSSVSSQGPTQPQTRFARGQRGKFTAALHAFELTLWCGLAWSYFLPPIIAPLCASSLVLTYGLRSSIVTGQFAERSFVLAFAVGNVGSMVYANAVYVTFTDLPQYGDHTDSMWMTTGLVMASFIGVRCLEAISPLRIRIDEVAREQARDWPILLVTGGVYFAVSMAFYTSAIDVRWSGKHTGSVSYITSALISYTLPFMFVLGNRLSPGLTRPKNLILFGVAALAGGMDMLTGYRGRAMLGVIAFAYGAIRSSQRAPRLKRELSMAAVVALPCLAVAFQVVGAARDDFAYTSIGRRIELVAERFEEDDRVDRGSMSGFDSVIARLFEASGQDVIARVKASGHRAGFEFFERLKFVMVPSFIVPDKKPMEIASEVMVRDFQYYQVLENTSIPITLVADSYRRGGWRWVFVVGLLAGILLRLQTHWTSVVVRGPLAEIAVGLMAVGCLRHYPRSVLGLLSNVTWYWLKALLIYMTVSMVIVVVHKSLSRES